VLFNALISEALFGAIGGLAGIGVFQGLVDAYQRPATDTPTGGVVVVVVVDVDVDVVVDVEVDVVVDLVLL